MGGELWAAAPQRMRGPLVGAAHQARVPLAWRRADHGAGGLCLLRQEGPAIRAGRAGWRRGEHVGARRSVGRIAGERLGALLEAGLWAVRRGGRLGGRLGARQRHLLEAGLSAVLLGALLGALLVARLAVRALGVHPVVHLSAVDL